MPIERYWNAAMKTWTHRTGPYALRWESGRAARSLGHRNMMIAPREPGRRAFLCVQCTKRHYRQGLALQKGDACSIGLSHSLLTLIAWKLKKSCKTSKCNGSTTRPSSCIVTQPVQPGHRESRPLDAISVWPLLSGWGVEQIRLDVRTAPT